jgi:NADPH-dependent ferric siderophore reductase
MTDHAGSVPSAAMHSIRRVRHELKRRALQVKRVSSLSPHMIRVTFTGDDLTGFASSAYDDHVKLFIPPDDMSLPVGNGTATSEIDTKPIARDYTPRRYDPISNELDIDFAIHEAGPATRWAVQAKEGQSVTIGGPRGSFVVPDDFTWYLLIGDETALPAIGRRLAELRSGALAFVVAEVINPTDEQIFETRATVSATWVHRCEQGAGDTTLLDDAVRRLRLPAGDGYAWIACESTVAKRLRIILLEEHGLPKTWVKAAGYWRRGVENIHERYED